jgi:hypothetical protein
VRSNVCIKFGVAEADVITAASEICKIQNFRVYKFIPPKMVDGCNAFLSSYEGELEEDLYATLKDRDVESAKTSFCAKACKPGKAPKAKASKGKKNNKKATMNKEL